MSNSLYLDILSRYQDSEIFDPFEFNISDNDNIIEYQGELDPDKNYFNQLAHHMSKNSNYYIEESFNKYTQKNNVINDDFSIIHVNIRSIPANLNIFYCTWLTSIMTSPWLVSQKHGWIPLILVHTELLDTTVWVWLEGAGRGGGVHYWYLKKWCIQSFKS